VRAEVVGIAPDVSGLVAEVLVSGDTTNWSPDDMRN
jgi:multidrug resistance efflux pump